MIAKLASFPTVSVPTSSNRPKAIAQLRSAFNA